MSASSREEIRFRSGDARCAAWLYRPARAPGPARPCVILGHGFCGTRAMRLDAFASGFADAGYVVLVFDYRHFGDSEGEPRQLLDIGRQHQDWHAAIAYARACPGVDPARIALWGSSLSGGHVLAIAADDPAIAAVIAQVPHVSGVAAARAAGLLASVRLGKLALQDALRARRGEPPLYVPAAGEPGSVAIMTLPGALAGVRRLIPEGAAIREDVAARIALAMPRYSPGAAVDRVRCPLLVQIAERDTLTPPAPAEAAAARAPRGELLRYPLDHFEMYVEPAFPLVVADQLSFLRRHLPI
jgi:hypothetical protein